MHKDFNLISLCVTSVQLCVPTKLKYNKMSNDPWDILFDIKYTIPNTEEREKVILKIIKRAQKNKDEDLEFEARLTYIDSLGYSEKPEKVLANFPWLLTTVDNNPGKYDVFQLLWYYKWVAIRIAKFPSISKKRILDIMEDMKRRYIAEGYSTKTILYFMRDIYQDFGEPELAKQKHQEWIDFEENDRQMGDCDACVLHNWVTYSCWIENYKEAIKKAKPLIKEKETCADVPLRTYGRAIYCHTQLDELEEAAKIYNISITKMNHKMPMLEDYGYIVIFLSLTGNYVRAKNIIAKQLPYALTFDCEYHIQEFYIAVLFFLKIAEEENRKKINLPKTIQLPVENKEGAYLVKNLIPFFEKEIERIAKLFNARNRNDFYSLKKDRVLALLKNKRALKV